MSPAISRATRCAPRRRWELVIVHPTDEPYHRRPDFFVDHLRPRLDTRFHVYTPEEFEQLADRDPVLRRAVALGEPVYAA